MKTSKQLIEQRAAMTEKIAELTAKEELTEAEKAELRTALVLEEELTRDVETALTVEKRNASIASKAAGMPTGDNEEKEMRNFNFGKFLSEGSQATGLEKELIEESRKEARELGIGTSDKGQYLSNKVLSAMIQPLMEKRTMQTSPGSSGGFLIPTVKLDYFDALFALSALDKMKVTKLSGLSANSDIPGIGASVVTGWANGEIATQTPSDPTLVNRSLTPKLLFAATNISKRLLIQTNQSVNDMILMNIMNALAQALQAAVINGSGASGQPLGFLGTSGIQTTAMGPNGAVISFAKVMELYAAVANGNANLDNAVWLTNPKVLARAMQTPIDTGSGFMIAPYNSFGGGAMGKIAGYDMVSTSSVPSDLTKGNSGAVCSALAFGDFSQIVVGQFGGIEVISDDITNARTGFRALTINQYNDVVVKQPSAIGAIVDILAG